MKRLPLILIGLMLTATFVFIACNDDDEEPDQYIDPTNTNGNANWTGTAAVTNSFGSIRSFGNIMGVTENNTDLHEAACRMEVPRLKGGSDNLFVVHTVPTYGINYCIEWNCNLRAQYWSAFRWDKSNSSKNTTRTNAWASDPLIPEDYRSTAEDHNGNGYTRGHILASEDRVNSYEANAQTFYYSNMHPQTYGFNTEGIWWNIENKLIRDVFNKDSFRDTLYVVKGGTIREGNYTIRNGIPVPHYFFVALLRKRNNEKVNDGYSALGFWMEHKDNTDNKYRNYAVSIKRLEELTGIDFFCNLPDVIENTVEQELSYEKWKL